MFRTECPLELRLPIPPAIVPTDDAVVQFSPAGGAYLTAKQLREDMLERRLVDAAGQCPVAQ